MAEPDIYTLLMGAEPDAAKTAKAMAARIRLGREAAMAGALGSPGAIGALGKTASGFATEDARLLEKAAETRLRSGEDAQNRAAQLKMTLAQIAANRPQFRGTPGNPAQAGFVWDPDVQDWVPKGPGYARPEGGGAGGKKGRPYSAGEVKTLQDANKLLGYVSQLHDDFKDEYAGEGMLGDYELKWDQFKGARASPKDMKRANYWKQVALNITNPQRHDLFGSALTSTEEAAWKAANPITIKSTPAEVRRALASLRDLLDQRLTERAAGRVSEGFDSDATAEYLSRTDYAKATKAAKAGAGGAPAGGDKDARLKALMEKLGL